jgi:PKD repeat protein
VNVTHAYSTAGQFIVQLTVTDEVGQSNTLAGPSIPIGNVSGGLFASFTFSPTNPLTGTTVNFNASSSTGGVVRYDWDFGDGSTDSRTTPTTSHAFGFAGSFVVRLTVFDSAGRSAFATQTVSVTNPPPPPAPAPPTVDFVFSPAAPNAGNNVVFTFTGNASSGASFSWVFGDGGNCPSLCGTGTQRNPTHVYAPGTPATTTNFNVTLTVTDNGTSASKTQSVPVKTP